MSERKNNKLKNNQVVQVVDWLRNNLTRIRAENWTTEKTAQSASAELGFPLSVHNIRGFMGRQQGVLIEHTWPGSGPKPTTEALNVMTDLIAETQSRQAILTRVLGELIDDLGLQLSNDTSILFDGLRKRLG